MKKIIDFNEFLIDKIFEKMEKRLKVNELELVLSPRLVKVLREIESKHQIADELLKLHIEESEPSHKMTFVDLGIEPNMVSFIQSNKVPDLIEPDIVHGVYTREFDNDEKFKGGFYNYVSTYRNPWISDVGHVLDLHTDQFSSKDHPVWKKNRAEISIQRFINKIFPKKFPANHTRKELDEMKIWDDVESFGNLFISSVEAHSKQFQLKEGNEIKYYYDCANSAKEGGTLGGSCMRSANVSNYFGIYVNNKEKVQMLVLFPEDNREKIIGRAIVWKLDGKYEGRYFMDRVYTANDSDQYMFLEYAKSKGWLYKVSQSHGFDCDIYDSKSDKKGREKLESILKSKEYDYYPYMDTFQFYDENSGKITNDYNSAKEKGKFIQLVSTSGGSSPI